MQDLRGVVQMTWRHGVVGAEPPSSKHPRLPRPIQIALLHLPRLQPREQVAVRASAVARCWRHRGMRESPRRLGRSRRAGIRAGLPP